MPTTVTKTIGTSSRDYSTLQAWEDACPANLVTDDKVWRGECYADAEFSSSSRLLYVSGMTVDSTRYVELTAAAGQSFQDHATVRTNALRYNTTNGVALRTTADFATTLQSGVSKFVVRRLQVKQDGNYSTAYGVSHFYDCVMRGKEVGMTNTTNVMINCTLYTTGKSPLQTTSNVTLVGNTIIGDGSSAGIDKQSTTSTLLLKNTAIFGCTAPITGLANASTTGSGNNASDNASGLVGSNNKHSVTYSQTTPFQDNRATSFDLRAVSGTDLIGNGSYDETYSPNDISGTARSATSPTIGAWEYVSASLAASQRPIAQAVKRSYFF